MRSQDEWDEHAAFMDGLAASGFILLGGLLGDEGDAMHAVNASDEDEVRSKFGLDPWSKSGHLETRSILRWTILLEAPPENQIR
jgi:uncharacterized protein YciI